MMTHVKMIHWALGVEEKNLEEAERYAEKAHEFREEHKAAADWCVEMARKHIEFNEKGNSVLTQLCREMEPHMAGNSLHEPMKTAVTEKRGHLAREAARIRMMLEMYDRG